MLVTGSLVENTQMVWYSLCVRCGSAFASSVSFFFCSCRVCPPHVVWCRVGGDIRCSTRGPFVCVLPEGSLSKGVGDLSPGHVSIFFGALYYHSRSEEKGCCLKKGVVVGLSKIYTRGECSHRNLSELHFFIYSCALSWCDCGSN